MTAIGTCLSAQRLELICEIAQVVLVLRDETNLVSELSELAAAELMVSLASRRAYQDLRGPTSGSGTIADAGDNNY